MTARDVFRRSLRALERAVEVFVPEPRLPAAWVLFDAECPASRFE